MAESPKDSSAANKGGVDLNSLSQLDFGPNWATGRKSATQGDRGKPAFRDGGHSSSPRGPRPERADRRQGGKPPFKGGERERRGDGARAPGGRREGAEQRGNNRRDTRPPMHREPEFEPIVEVNFYPQDEAFDALVTRLQANYRTYELFELVRLILAKPERVVIAIASPEKTVVDGQRPPLYYSVPDNLPFLNEDAALDHVMAHFLERFFTVEAVEVEPPKGNFVVVQRCGVTGELLGPPNYHRYAGFLQEHYAKRIHGMSFERFQSKLETVKDPEAVTQWVDKMKQGWRFTEVLPPVVEGEGDEALAEAPAPVVFEDRDALRRYLVNKRKAEVVGSAEWVRMDGKALGGLPAGPLKRSIEFLYEKQKRFPLDTANNLRGRLRRENFTIYKRGPKGASMVCAVKRKFRDPKTVFSDSIVNLIGFIEENPMIHAHDLPERFLGLEPMKMPVPVAKDIDEDELEKAKSSEPTLKPEDAQRLLELSRDLKWLVSEGYVSEFGDGRLWVHPPATVAKPKEKLAKKPTPAKTKPKAKPAKADAAAKPAAKEPAAPESTAKPKATEPAASQTAATEPTAPESAATEPAAQEPAAKEPAAQEPANAEPAKADAAKALETDDAATPALATRRT